MIGYRSALVRILCVCALTPGMVQAEVYTDAEKAFDKEHYTTVIELLESKNDSGQSQRMLGLSYFHLNEFEKALPLLNQTTLANRDDIEVIEALIEIELARREYDRVSELKNDLCRQCGANMGEDLSPLLKAKLVFVEARIQLGREDGNRAAAKEVLLQLMEKISDLDLDLALRAADVLIEAHLYDGEIDAAHKVALVAMSKHPNGENSVRYQPFTQESQEASGFRYNIGYHFEYDNNITFPEENFASGQGDYRHVLMVDINYQKPLQGNWEFFALGNLYQSFHHDLDQFNRTRMDVSAAIGHSYKRTGWRLPVEIIYELLDGESFRTSLAAIPGFYIQFSQNLFSHVYARVQSDDYFEPLFAKDDRSGDVLGAGVLVTGQVSRRFNLRSYLEFNHYDTDGAYWKRQEIVAFAQGEFEFRSRWIAGLAYRFVDEDYTNARSIFNDRQKDRSHELYLNLTHRFGGGWRWRAQISLIDHKSNIALYDYDRNVYSFAVIREF